MSVKNYNIQLPKKDFLIIELKITENGEVVELESTDEIYFTVKRNATDENYVFQKSLKDGITYNASTKNYEIQINSNDTKEMLQGQNAGTYGYDITIYYNGNMPKQKVIGDFKIGKKYTLNEVI